MKIFWGVAKTASSADPAGVYSVNITFPEHFSNSNYFFTASNTVITSDQSSKAESVFNYYQRTNYNIWVGSTSKSNCNFNWFAIGF